MNLSEKDIIICGIIRDSAKYLRNNIPVIDELCSKFNDFRIIIYENDSIDDTKDVLANWHETNPSKIHIISENIERKDTSYMEDHVRKDPFLRVGRLGELRNRYMEFIDVHKLSTDYLMVVDLDIAWLDVNNIMTSFYTTVKWDGVAAFGYSIGPLLRRRYHDTFALTEYGDEKNPQTKEKIIRLASKFAKFKPTDEWIRVFAAFGGLAIYKFEAVKGFRYYPIENDDEYIKMRCEHYGISKYMADHGYDKFYVNPAMVLKYQDLTWNIVLNSIKRRLGIM